MKIIKAVIVDPIKISLLYMRLFNKMVRKAHSKEWQFNPSSGTSPQVQRILHVPNHH